MSVSLVSPVFVDRGDGFRDRPEEDEVENENCEVGEHVLGPLV